MTVREAFSKRMEYDRRIRDAKADLLCKVRALDFTGFKDFWYVEPGPANLAKPELWVTGGRLSVNKTHGKIPAEMWTIAEAEFVATILPAFLKAYAEHELDQVKKWETLVDNVIKADDDIPF